MKLLELKGEIPYVDSFFSLDLFLKECDNFSSEKRFNGRTILIVFTEECLIVIEYNVIKIVYLTGHIKRSIDIKIFGKYPKKIKKVEKMVLDKFQINDLTKTEIKEMKKH